ncbi:MAG: type 4a pilus biogenesis protein PilO [Candidatus Omnitrophica bacterium]|nr:type 4a pilus biogenesis protein PilO [Candidatus Omnitrophota bacterium]
MELKGITLNKNQKIIFLMAFIVIVGIIVLWIFIYNPARNKMKRLKEELAFIESEIKKIEMISGGTEKLDIAYEKFYKKFAELERLIPVEEKTTLSELSSTANEMNIEVLSTKPGKIRPAKLSIEMGKKRIMAMPISMNIRCNYVNLGEYLNTLRNELPTLISVDDVNIISPKREGATQLNVALTVTLYMLKD